ncbi:hypothetical protein PS928_06170 [Pseudomonas fluorescens]|uniref:Uncharacterized protein n=1 Tax=Pseudomonas fluorescens TaxID=294 RepID=A0A5E7VTS8_PSEFL|nr:hypothetical protein PS928_06170 [Pseudomonas fluorescens]
MEARQGQNPACPGFGSRQPYPEGQAKTAVIAKSLYRHLEVTNALKALGALLSPAPLRWAAFLLNSWRDSLHRDAYY